MKILYVLDTFYPKVDGPATVIDNIARILTENKLAQVDLLVPYYPKYKDKFSFKVIRCASIFGPDKYRTGLPQLNINLKRLLKEEKYDIIHVHSPFTVGKYAIKFAKKNKIPSINTIHTQYKSDFERKLKSKFLQNFMMKYVSKVLNNSDYVLTVSKGFTTEVNEIYGYKKKVNFIRNATEFKDNKDLTKIVANIRKKNKLKDEFVFLFVGRVVENKNVQYSLKVLCEVKKAGFKDFKFIIVGEGNYLDTLKNLAKEYNLEDNVIFTGLIKDREELSGYYKVADLFMFPSTFDTCGIVALEAASFGLPSIMLKNSYASELIEHFKNGFVASEDINEWKDIIIKLINSKDILPEIKECTKKTINKSWEEIAIEYFNFYKFVILLDNIKKNKLKIFVKNNKIKGIKKLKKSLCRTYKPFKN